MVTRCSFQGKYTGLGSRRSLVVKRWERLIVKKMTCVTEKRSALQQYWNTGISFAPKIPGQTPSTVFFMLTCKNWAPKIGFEPCKTKKSTCLLLFWITISFGGNAPAVFWSSTRPAARVSSWESRPLPVLNRAYTQQVDQNHQSDKNPNS